MPHRTYNSAYNPQNQSNQLFKVIRSCKERIYFTINNVTTKFSSRQTYMTFSMRLLRCHAKRKDEKREKQQPTNQLNTVNSCKSNSLLTLLKYLNLNAGRVAVSQNNPHRSQTVGRPVASYCILYNLKCGKVMAII